jgi:hypothetical protein
MIAGYCNGSICTTSFRGRDYLVSFTGRFAYGRPENLLKRQNP